MKIFPIAGLLVLSLAACSQKPEAATADTPAMRGAANAPADPDMSQVSAVDTRNDSPARLDGFGAVSLGASVDELRSRFGAPLRGLSTDAAGRPLAEDDHGDDCYYLRPEKAAPEGPNLMIEGRRLVRYEVEGPAIVAPGGGRVGMTLGELQQLYPERADVEPGKYNEQVQHLRVRPAQDGQGIINFELGPDGKVDAWRVGLPPQVDYVEGCG